MLRICISPFFSRSARHTDAIKLQRPLRHRRHSKPIDYSVARRRTHRGTHRRRLSKRLNRMRKCYHVARRR
jgi:hypothetical protein